MSERVSEKEVQEHADELKKRVNDDLCRTEFSGRSLDEFMKYYKKGDTLESRPVWDDDFERQTVALTIKRNGVSLGSEQRGKPIGD